MAFQSEHFEYLIDKSKTENIPYLSELFEDSYDRLAEFYSYHPEKPIHVLFLDEDDISNGYAFSAQGWIVIMLPPADFDLRGKTPWLPNVIAHELAHIITLRKMGVTSRFLGYNLMTAFALRQKGAISMSADVRWKNIPAWFAEGLAQIGSQTCGYDTTDGFRRMILKTALEHDDLLSLPEMSAFGWDARSNEMIYTQGYFFTAFLYEKYGRETMNRILETMKRDGFASGFTNVVSKAPEDLYRDWLEHLDSTVTRSSPMIPTPALISLPGNVPYVNQNSPVKSADGILAYLSSERNDFGITDLYVRTGGRAQLVKRRANGPLNVSPDGKFLYFTAQSVSWKSGRITSDLYRYDFIHGLTSRLTVNGRVTFAAPDQNGTLYIISENAGRTSFSRLEENGLTLITRFPVHMKLSGLSQGGEPGTLLVEVSTGRGADIFSIDVLNGDLTPLLDSKADERDPRWDREEGRLLFSADFTGTYQIYSLRNDSITQWTHGERNHLAPMAHGGNLFSRTYSREGFVLDSVPMSGGEILDIVRDSIPPNTPFSPPSPTQVERKKWGDDGMKYLGYAGFARIVQMPERFDMFRTTDETSPLYQVNDPGDYFKWTAGGAGIWMHPGQESQVYLEAGVSDELGHDQNELPYLSDALAFYSNHSFGPIFNGFFQSSTHRIPQDELSDRAFAYTLMRFSLSLDWRLNNYLSLTGFGNYSGISISTESSGLLTDFSGGGTVLGNQLQFVVYQPGVNFPNQLLFLQSGIGYAPAFGASETLVNWNSLTLATNSHRRVFYQATAAMTSILTEDFDTEFEGFASLSFDWHLPVHFPFEGSGLFLTNILPSLGVGFSSTPEPNASVNSSYSGHRPSHHQPGGNVAAAQGELVNLWENGRMDMVVSTTLKMVSPLKNVIHWNFFYAFPIQANSRNAYLGINLSL